MKLFIRRSLHWLLLFLLTDAVFLFATWLLRPAAFRYMLLFLGLFTAVSLAAGIGAEIHIRKKEEDALLHFLELSKEQTGAELPAHFSGSRAADMLCAQIFSLQAQISEKLAETNEYHDYIEAWVHEAKTPLALSTMILDNHRDEMPPYVYTRLQYAQHQLHEDIERILYYARLQADHPDIQLSRFRLDECAAEALSEYRPFLEEQHISAVLALKPAEVDSDRRIVLFMISQLFSNAVKYADSEKGKIAVGIRQEGDEIHLDICNNGKSVPPEDTPFLFDKGFTGSRPGSRKATGMGLYLVSKYGQKLCVGVRLKEQIPCESGFGIELIFTR